MPISRSNIALSAKRHKTHDEDRRCPQSTSHPRGT
jgi:hypothetical protein